MDEKTLQALTLLANKLGTTAEQLWSILLAQAPISAGISAVQAIVCIAVTVGWVLLTYRKTRVLTFTRESGYKYTEAEWSGGDTKFAAWFAAAVFIGASLAFSLAALSEIPVVLMNPDYWALREVLRLVK